MNSSKHSLFLILAHYFYSGHRNIAMFNRYANKGQFLQKRAASKLCKKLRAAKASQQQQSSKLSSVNSVSTTNDHQTSNIRYPSNNNN